MLQHLLVGASAAHEHVEGMVGAGDRADKVRTYNFPQDRVTDHRIGLTIHNIPGVLEGELDALIDALVTTDQAERLRTLVEGAA